MIAKSVISDLPDSDITGKKVFVRVDFNVPIKNSRISEDYRIRRTIPTIDFLVEKGAKVILASHLGRPKGEYISSLSLRPVALRLTEFLGKDVKFVGKIIGKEVEDASNDLKNGDVMLLENLRFHIEERNNDSEFAKKLSSLADIYINDAFGTSHRAHASTYGMALNFEKRLSGFLVDREIRFLGTLLDNPMRPYVVIVGGAKIKDKIGALKNLIEKADHVLLGGGIAYTFLKAKGISIGKSICEDEMLPWAREALETFGNKISLPVDHIVSESFDNVKTPIVIDNEIPEHYQGFDIGPKTVNNYSLFIKGNGTIFWNGPMGLFEIEDFSSGTTSIARSIALATWRGATTVVGGGDSIAAMRNAEVLDLEVSHISTGGGASLEFLGGSELPGIAVLNNASDKTLRS